MTIQKLKHGLVLCKNNFSKFVESFNFLVDFVQNLKGDMDVDGASVNQAHITIDRSSESHPIIRFVAEKTEQAEAVAGVTSIVGENNVPVKGTVTATGSDGSGLVVTTTDTSGAEDSGTIEIDIAERAEGEDFAPREVIVQGQVIAKMFGTTDFEIAQKTLLAGCGISLEEDENNITISTIGCGTSLSGYTGERNVIVDIDYSNHQLRKKFAKENWENGLLKTTEVQSWETYHTAVEETV